MLTSGQASPGRSEGAEPAGKVRTGHRTDVAGNARASVGPRLTAAPACPWRALGSRRSWLAFPDGGVVRGVFTRIAGRLAIVGGTVVQLLPQAGPAVEQRTSRMSGRQSVRGFAWNEGALRGGLAKTRPAASRRQAAAQRTSAMRSGVPWEGGLRRCDGDEPSRHRAMSLRTGGGWCREGPRPGGVPALPVGSIDGAQSGGPSITGLMSASRVPCSRRLVARPRWR
jgi:hypothetical protein